MNANTNRSRQPDPRVVFLQDFFRRPREVGSIIPSSRFLERRIVRCAKLRDANTVVELGPGTGGTTRALLRAMGSDTHLLVIEINGRFAQVIRDSVHDPRLSVCRGNAARISEILADHEFGAPEVVLSGIPFSTMPAEKGIEILRAVHDSLAPGGRFVAYQVRDRVKTLGRKVFGSARIQTELLNVPPMRVFCWDKRGDA
jgi:phosphatidylethanolamine/phosphatidyl-N-methylethanolamine N-methyltransferase